VQEAEIYKNLASVFHDIFDDRSIVLQPGTNASNIEGRDSMNHIGLIAATEAVFGVNSIPMRSNRSLTLVNLFAQLGKTFFFSDID
jgi:hypothetical protein